MVACRPPTCSARYRTPLPTSSSKVSPRIGLKGFHARSAAPKGETRYAATHANLHGDEREVDACAWWMRRQAVILLPLVWVAACVCLVQQLGVLHDFGGLLQDRARLHDPDGHAEERGDVHANVLLELLGAPGLLPLLRSRAWGDRILSHQAAAEREMDARPDARPRRPWLRPWWPTRRSGRRPRAPPSPGTS